MPAPLETEAPQQAALAPRNDEPLEAQIEHLLAAPEHASHPLQAPLAELYARHQSQLVQLERLTSISDGYQLVLQSRHKTLSERYERQLRQLQKIVRISDQYQEMLRDLNKAFKIASTHDSLTGLANRRMITERLHAQAALSAKKEQPFCIAMIDIDHFKAVNDQFGHDMGDQVLVRMAAMLDKNLRACDVCSRWGGEEFLVILAGAASDAGFDAVQRLMKILSNMSPEEWGCPVLPTLSVGVAQYRPGEPLDETIKRADNSLYEAKRSGRNQVKVASDVDEAASAEPDSNEALATNENVVG